MATESLTEQLRQLEEAIDLTKVKGMLDVQDDHMLITIVPDVEQLDILEGSILRAEAEKDDRPLAELMRDTLQDRRRLMCNFVTQKLDDRKHEALSAADYNNLGCAYMWCKMRDGKLSDADKNTALGFFRAALGQTTDTAIKNRIKANITLIDPPKPKLDVPGSLQAKIRSFFDRGGDVGALKDELEQS